MHTRALGTVYNASSLGHSEAYARSLRGHLEQQTTSESQPRLRQEERSLLAALELLLKVSSTQYKLFFLRFARPRRRFVVSPRNIHAPALGGAHDDTVHNG